ISHRIVAEGDRRAAGVSDRLLRLSVGLEDVEDLWRDLTEALSSRTAPSRRPAVPRAAGGLPTPAGAGPGPR
ncbi:cystathionine gamma-synthase, partial [Streptomyces solincola]